MIAIGRQMTVNFRSPIPVFRQIADILLAQIDTGDLPAGEPIRALSTGDRQCRTAG